MSNFGHDDYFLDKEDQLQGVLRSTAHDNWYHMLNMLDKFNEEVWDHSRKREFIRSVIANMFHFFPFSEIRNVVLKTAVSSRIVFTNIQQKSWTVIDHMLRIPDIVKHSIVSSILNGLEGHKILSREFVKWDEKIFRMIKMNIRTRNELAFIASIFPVMRSKPMPKSVWDEILLALVDDKVIRENEPSPKPIMKKSVQFKIITIIPDVVRHRKKSKISDWPSPLPSSPPSSSSSPLSSPKVAPELDSGTSVAPSVYDPIDWASLLKSRSPSPDPFANFINNDREPSLGL